MAGLTQNEAQDSTEPIAGINITPFVDVVLVLLVIFMVTAPMILKDVIAVRLPKAASGDGSSASTLSIVVMKNGNVLLNGALASEDDIRRAVVEAMKRNPDTQAIISADEEALHKYVVSAIDWIKTAGLSKFALQIQKKEP